MSFGGKSLCNLSNFFYVFIMFITSALHQKPNYEIYSNVKRHAWRKKKAGIDIHGSVSVVRTLIWITESNVYSRTVLLNVI